MRACFCIGPQNREPACPCRMRNIRVRNGRYVEERDLGEAPDPRDARIEDFMRRMRKRQKEGAVMGIIGPYEYR